MELSSPTLLIEINNSEYIFVAVSKNEQDNINIVYKSVVPIAGIQKFRITDFHLAVETIKKNIFLIEKKLNFIFKESTIIINNFNCSIVNLTGFKKMNGSQILKENITYILNTLKSNIDKTEEKNTILHIFNSKYFLDQKEIDNLPIGLFGDFYSHELSFCLINNNDYKNLNKIFEKTNLKIRKILLKSYVEGSWLSNTNTDLDTFFVTKINKKNSQVFYFENDSLRQEQVFNFGSDLIINDISKITALKQESVRKIVSQLIFNQANSDNNLIEKEFFNNESYKKIKKKLIYDIASARIQELSEILISKNINFFSFYEKNKVNFLTISDDLNFKSFEEIFKFYFSYNRDLDLRCIKDVKTDDIVKNAYNIVHFGWKKEAVPVIHAKKSFISRFFEEIFI